MEVIPDCMLLVNTGNCTSFMSRVDRMYHLQVPCNATYDLHLIFVNMKHPGPCAQRVEGDGPPWGGGGGGSGQTMYLSCTLGLSSKDGHQSYRSTAHHCCTDALSMLVGKRAHVSSSRTVPACRSLTTLGWSHSRNFVCFCITAAAAVTDVLRKGYGG